VISPDFPNDFETLESATRTPKKSRAGQPGSLGEPDKKRVDVSAFPAEIAGLQHKADIADTTAPRLGAAKAVIDHPVVDRPRLVERRGAGADDLLRLFENDAVGRRARGRTQIFGKLGR
jgi:hypothetical protein